MRQLAQQMQVGGRYASGGRWRAVFWGWQQRWGHGSKSPPPTCAPAPPPSTSPPPLHCLQAQPDMTEEELQQVNPLAALLRSLLPWCASCYIGIYEWMGDVASANQHCAGAGAGVSGLGWQAAEAGGVWVWVGGWGGQHKDALASGARGFWLPTSAAEQSLAACNCVVPLPCCRVNLGQAPDYNADDAGEAAEQQQQQPPPGEG